MTYSGQQRETEEALASFSTPFNVLNVANQNVQFSISPDSGLTKRRYLWYSNGTRFDETFFTSVEAGIEVSTGTNSTDEARIQSAIAGRYISQSLAKPGMGLSIDPSNTQIDDNNFVSLTNGEVIAGAFWWDDVNGQVDTGVGFKWDTDGWKFFVKSLGNHLGNSPIPQSEFNIDKFDSKGPSGQLHDPPIGYVYNWPYTWYNEGSFEAGYLSKVQNRFEEALRFSTDGPSIDTPNLPVQLVVRNNGDAESLTAQLGGMQYSTYGAGVQDIEFRETDETRITNNDFIADTKAITENAIDPSAEPGVPLISIQRQAGERDLAVAIQQIEARPVNDDIYVFQWDEWNPDTALTGASFTNPVTINGSKESKTLTDTQATDYTPSSTALLRSVRLFSGGTKNEVGAQVTQRIDARTSIDATRVVTAVTDGDQLADVDPIIVKMEESF